MEKKNKKTVIAITGPTASGKTALAINAAKFFNTEIISADSRQIFKEFDIATAKPSLKERRGIKHHLMDIISPTEEFTVADFADRARTVMEQLFEQGKIPIVAGGTGLYFRILLENYDMPRVAPNKELREELQKIEKEKGVETLYEMLKQADPVLAENMHPNNTRKIIRALEVCKTLNMPMSQAQKKTEPLYDVHWFGLGHLNGEDRQYLYDRTDKRVDIMLRQGLEAEAEQLFEKYGKIPSLMNTIGYQEFIEYFEGNSTFDETVEKIKQNTRRYAKRQLTWFRKNEQIEWLDTIRVSGGKTDAGFDKNCGNYGEFDTIFKDEDEIFEEFKLKALQKSIIVEK